MDRVVDGGGSWPWSVEDSLLRRVVWCLDCPAAEPTMASGKARCSLSTLEILLIVLFVLMTGVSASLISIMATTWKADTRKCSPIPSWASCFSAGVKENWSMRPRWESFTEDLAVMWNSDVIKLICACLNFKMRNTAKRRYGSSWLQHYWKACRTTTTNNTLHWTEWLCLFIYLFIYFLGTWQKPLLQW